MQKFQVLYGSMDLEVNGLYIGTQQVASFRQLDRKGYDLVKMVGWSQKALAEVAKKFSR